MDDRDSKLSSLTRKKESSSWCWKREHKIRMGNLLDSGFLSDINIQIGKEGERGRSIKAHKLLLQAGSPELHRKIQELEILNEEENEETSKLLDMQQQQQKQQQQCFTLMISDAEYESFITFLKFLYTGDTGEVQDPLAFLPLLKIAIDYQVSTLVEVCVFKLKECLCEANAFQIFQCSMKCGHKGLMQYTLTFICKYAWKLIDTDGFAELNEDCLCEILKPDELQVKSEILLFHAVIRWAEAECVRNSMKPSVENVIETLSRIIGLIRFPVMDQAEFTLNVALKNILGLEELVKILVYFTIPADKKGEISPGRFLTTPRKYYKEPQPLGKKRTTMDVENPTKLTTTPTEPGKGQFKAKCVFPYQAQAEDELTLVVGDIVTILSTDCHCEGWWKGELRGKVGLLPDNFAKII